MSPPYRIVADINERTHNSTFYQKLAARPDILLEHEVLGVGDYEIFPGHRVERKSIQDFTNSIRSKRLFDQVESAIERGASFTVLLEGDPFALKAFTDNAIAGAISYLSLLRNVKIITTPNTDIAVQMLYTMAKHLVDGPDGEISLRAPTPKTPEDQTLFLLTGLPGVGQKTAENLLDHFGSPRGIFSATVDQLRSVKGVGPKLSSSIVDLLTRPWKEK